MDDLSFSIDDYIPASAYGGTVIITSRRPECADGRRGIEVEQMDDYEAQQLLRNCAKQQNKDLSPTGKKPPTIYLLRNARLTLASLNG